MGFRAQKKTITVRFAEDHPLYGLEAVFRGMDIRSYLKMTGMDGSDGDGVGGGIDRAAEALLSWNLEDEDGKPVEATAENFMAQEHEFALGLSSAWFEALAGVPKTSPLDTNSPSGEKSPEASIPMEIGE